MTTSTKKYKISNKKVVIFRKLGVTTLITLYLLILAGGIVRSTGSGMGCPDWPKCFGQWVPPTEASALPENYKDIYSNKRKAKNLRLAGMLEKLGFKDLSKRMREDKEMYVEEDFNASKTWIEYINRLLGVLTGFFILFTLISSLTFYNTDPKFFWITFASFVLVGFQGWIGSIVVSTNLLQGMITFHMLLAVVIVFFLIYLVARAYGVEMPTMQISSRLRLFLNATIILSIVLLLVQISFGTLVRAALDEVARAFAQQRSVWISQLGDTFFIHRSFSWLLLASHGALFYGLFRLRKQASRQLYVFSLVLLGVTGLEILFGAGMAYFAVPAFLQPLHLLFAILASGLQFYILLLLNPYFINSESLLEGSKKISENDYSKVSY